MIVTDSPAASSTITSPSVPPMVSLPAVTAVTTASVMLFATLPVKPLTRTCMPTVKPAATKPLPESL